MLAVPLAVVLLVAVAWAVDTATGGDVARNVEVAGRDVGGDDAAALRAAIDRYGSDLAARPVELVTSDGTYETTAGDLGLSVDADATARRAMEADDGFVLARPFRWAASFVAPYAVDPVLRVDVDAAYQTVIALEGAARVPPVEPAMTLTDDGRLELIPGQPGSGIGMDELAERLPAAALDDADPIVVTIEPSPLPPATDDGTVAAAIDEANVITDVPLTIEAGGQQVVVDPEDQRAWLRLEGIGQPFGEPPSLVLDEETALADLAERFPQLGDPPVDATVTLGSDGRPVVVPGEEGTGCCAPGSGEAILDAMRGGTGSVELEITTQPPDHTTEEVQGWGIVEPVGGTRAWPESRSGSVGPGFTTFHAAGEARVTNIHRIADLVRGAVIPPGGSFSVNEHVGRRTAEKGFVGAGAIRNGEHVTEIGGGVSQFATTLFNAAYFAGLDITKYQAHSEYFSRYPRGREATMGYPEPDLVIENNTPYGVLIWTSYTGSSLTITLYSTPFATGEQTGISESRSGNCTVVTTERTRTFVDGRPPVTDTFRATYRPGEGQFC